jgi:hypothetical protein
MLIKTFGLLLFIVPLFVISCSKGDAGPAGPAGPAGAAGPTGSQGPAGSANVIYSSWFTASPWTKDTVFDVYGFNYDKPTTDITQKVLDSGVVLTFGKLDGYNTLIWPTAQVAPLPITISYRFSPAGITYNDTWTALATPGNLRIRFIDDQNYYGSIATAHQFRYVIVPGGAKSSVASVSPGLHMGKGTQPSSAQVNEVVRNFRQMSYSEICRRLAIPE